MCSIAASYSVRGDAIQDVQALLRRQSHRGHTSFGVWANEETHHYSVLPPASEGGKAVFALAHSLLPVTPHSRPQPVTSCQKGLVLVLNGQLYNLSELSAPVSSHSGDILFDAAVAVHFIEEQLSRGNSIRESIRSFAAQANGDYAIILRYQNSVYAFRDPLGIKPVWFGEDDGSFLIASEPTALKGAGVQWPHPLIPGHLLTLDAAGFNSAPLYPFQSSMNPTARNSSAEHLHRVVQASVQYRASSLRKAGLFFSGGLDSALLAHYLKKAVPSLTLYTTAFPGSEDWRDAETLAARLELPISLIEVPESDLASYARETVKALGFYDPLQLQIGLPEFIAAETARKDGQRVVFSGQGADELFCGYRQFTTLLSKEGYAGVENGILEMLRGLWHRNLYREDIVTMRHSLQLRVPFLDPDFIQTALSIPAQEKIHSPVDALRKHPLRKLAKWNGLDPSIAARQKKAIQFSSGTTRALRKATLLR